jgi:putative spermidine/putrescine transport system ATP-binding protein/putrescine transport system ATP-binding protein
MDARYPSQLSGGQQQRVALARALATDPQIVLLDEPLSALDAKLRLELRIELREILTSVGATTIVVTHDQEEALSLGDEVIIMRSGRIVQRGTPSEIYEAPKDKFVAEFVGRSNWFRARRKEHLADDLEVYRTDEGLEIRAMASRSNAADVADLCVRPENIELVTEDDLRAGDQAGLNALSGVILNVAPLGADLHVVLQLAGKTRLLAIRKNVGTLSRLLPGQPIKAVFSATEVHVF